MASHDVHDRRVTPSSHRVFKNGLTQDILGIAAAAKATATTSTEALAHEAIV